MTIPASQIKLNPDNPRIIKDDKFKKLVNSLKEFPEMASVRPVVINQDNVILGGNMRFRAMVEAGWEEIPVTKVDWTEDQQRQFVIKDNVSGGEWDWDTLADQWDAEELDKWGLDVPVDFGDDEQIEEDEAPEVSEEAVSELGAVYQLGRHRVLCGDSTDATSVELLMDGAKADMVFTDPPYGMDLDTDYTKMAETKVKSKTYDKVIGDNADYDAGHIFDTFPYCNEIFLWGADWYYNTLPLHGSWIVWDKRNEASDGLTGNHFEMLWSKQRHRRRIIRHLWSGFTARNADTSRVHPTEKPTKVLADILNDYSEANAKVVDLFLGSGSTLIACEQTDRTCYGMELDPKYVDVIRKRYAKFVSDNELPENWQELTPRVN